MADIVTSRVFVDGEKGITAAKLNDIVASSVIQPAFYTSKPTAGTADPTDIALILKSGAYAQVPISTLGGSATQAQIWSTRLRSFNSLGNCDFECDQRTVGAGTSGAGTFAQDRWYRGGTLSFSASRTGGVPVVIPGTSYAITQNILRLTLLAQKVSLAATDLMYMQQWVEGPSLRELISDTHSLSLLVRSSVANVVFGIALRDSASAYTLTKLCTGGAANTWTLIQLPNLPVWSPSATWLLTPGSTGYIFDICLASGATNLSPANDTWQTGNFTGAAGQGNFANNLVNSTFDIAFVQHEPGAVCSTFMDKPFSQNLDECLRYFTKSYNYATLPGTASNNAGAANVVAQASQNPLAYLPFPSRMAKTPTITGYSTVTGAANIARDTTASVERTITSVSVVGEAAFGGFTLAGLNSAIATYQLHWTADTGW
jgi:hypothetical protein